MQFLILAYDATDADAINRRMAARAAHIETIGKYKSSGNMHLGVAILDDAGKMIGSAIIAEFPSRKELDEWLAKEPYVTGKIWEKIEIKACQIGPSFSHILALAPINLETLRKRYRDRIMKSAAENQASNVRIFGSVARGEFFDKENDGFLVSMVPGASIFDIGGLSADLEEIFGQYIHVIDDSVDMSKIPYDMESIVDL